MSGAVLTAPFPTETLMNHFHNEMTFGQVGNDIALRMLITAATHTLKLASYGLHKPSYVSHISYNAFHDVIPNDASISLGTYLRCKHIPLHTRGI